MLTLPRTKARQTSTNPNHVSSTSEMDSEEENVMMKPNFRLGAYSTSYGGASKLGSLAALANYNSEKEGECLSVTFNFECVFLCLACLFPVVKDLSFTGTDISNPSEQAWDPYQEKYMSEAYSEGFDSDAARRLLEFGDDYRNFLDSQSDNCSSLSAANNLDSSLSPLVSRRPNMLNGASGGSANRSGGWSSSKSASKSPSGDDYTVQRRRKAIEVEYDRRRKGSEGSRKVMLEGKKLQIFYFLLKIYTYIFVSTEFSKSMGIDRLLSSTNKPANNLSVPPSDNPSTKSPRSTHRSSTNAINRKLEMEFISNLDKRILDEDMTRRRHRSERTFASKVTLSASSQSSSAASEVEDDSELVELLVQTKNRLENTDALRIRSHLLRPEDYVSGCPKSNHLRVDTKNEQLCTKNGWLGVCALVVIVACGVVALGFKRE